MTKRENLAWNTVEATERQLKAVELRMAGKTFREIAQELGYAHPSGAYAAVQSVLKEARAEAAEEMSTLELDRLQKLIGALWDKAMAGDVKAAHAILAIIDKKAKLMGLYTPTKYQEVVEVTYVNDWGRKKTGLNGLMEEEEDREERAEQGRLEREAVEIEYGDWGPGFE